MEVRRRTLRAGGEALTTRHLSRTRRVTPAARRSISRPTAMRPVVSRVIAVWLAVIPMVTGLSPVFAAACALPAGFTPRARVEQGGVVILYRTEPASIEVGKHFSIDAVVCADAGTAVLERVDATMPEHRHGMNYRATVGPNGTGRYMAKGLLFHMPGRWEIVFDVERAGQRTRLTSEVELE